MGLLIAQDPESHKLMVLGPIRGSPAERAGIQAGDEVSTCVLSCRVALSASKCREETMSLPRCFKEGRESLCALVVNMMRTWMKSNMLGDHDTRSRLQCHTATASDI